jgi:hypothetical protein
VEKSILKNAFALEDVPLAIADRLPISSVTEVLRRAVG